MISRTLRRHGAEFLARRASARRRFARLLVLPCCLALLCPPVASARVPEAHGQEGAGGPSAESRAQAQDAFRAAALGEWPRAFSLIAPVADPLAHKTLRWLRMMDDSGPESFAEFAAFITDNPHWPLPERAQVLAEGRIKDPVDHDLIRRFFDARSPLTTRGQIRYAEALLTAGERERAVELLRRAWREGDFSGSEGTRFERRYGRLLTQEDHIARLDNLLWDHRLGSAAQMLERVPEPYRRLGEARLRLQRQSAGVDRAIQLVPASLRDDPGLVFDRIRWRRHKHMHDGALELLLAPPQELVRPKLWWFEREYQIRRALRQRDFRLAYELARRHGQTEGEEFADAEWLTGWLALRFMGEPGTALAHFERLHAGVSTPISRGRAAYWAGRAAAALGEREEALSWYREATRSEIAYYGQLAAAELGLPARPLTVAPAGGAQRQAFESKELVRVVRMLLAVDADEQLRPFLMRLAGDAETPAEVGLVAALAAESGRPHLVTMVGKYAAYYGVVNPTAAFPVPEIERMLRPRPGQPDPALLLGVARQESVFNPRVVSRAGARGLLQLMPATADLVARQLGLRHNVGLLTGDLDYNVRLGSHYLAGLIQRYGQVELAVAAYNAGPRRVDEWLRLHGDPRRGDAYDLVDWLELIPFSETRNYVQRVMENYAVYRARLSEPEPVLVSMRPVNGPLEPLPLPVAKPGAPARQFAELAEPEPESGPLLLDGAPVPRLKPDEGEIVPAGFRDVPLPRLKPEDVSGRLGGSNDAPAPHLRPADVASSAAPAGEDENG